MLPSSMLRLLLAERFCNSDGPDRLLYFGTGGTLLSELGIREAWENLSKLYGVA